MRPGAHLRRRLGAVLVVALVLAASGRAGSPGRNPCADATSTVAERAPSPAARPAPQRAQPVRVRRVVDGDTVVLDDRTRTRVRVLGIDTAELGADGSDQCGALPARDLTRRAAEGRTVALTADPSQADRDRYGRLLRYLTLPDGRDLGLELLRAGLADVYAPAGRFARQHAYRAAAEAGRDRIVRCSHG